MNDKKDSHRPRGRWWEREGEEQMRRNRREARKVNLIAQCIRAARSRGWRITRCAADPPRRQGEPTDCNRPQSPRADTAPGTGRAGRGKQWRARRNGTVLEAPSRSILLNRIHSHERAGMGPLPAGTSRHPEPHGETTGGRVTPARPNDEAGMRPQAGEELSECSNE